MEDEGQFSRLRKKTPEMPGTVSKTFPWSNVTPDHKTPSWEPYMQSEYSNSSFAIIRWIGYV